jgi:hypothetical protein
LKLEKINETSLVKFPNESYVSGTRTAGWNSAIFLPVYKKVNDNGPNNYKE